MCLQGMIECSSFLKVRYHCMSISQILYRSISMPGVLVGVAFIFSSLAFNQSRVSVILFEGISMLVLCSATVLLNWRREAAGVKLRGLSWVIVVSFKGVAILFWLLMFAIIIALGTDLHVKFPYRITWYYVALLILMGEILLTIADLLARRWQELRPKKDIKYHAVFEVDITDRIEIGDSLYPDEYIDYSKYYAPAYERK